jgi:hypothetical protein
MKPVVKALAFVLMLAIAFSCDKEDPVPPYVVNNSVKPVDFLTEKQYQVLNIEVAYVEGYQPTEIALDNLVAFFKQRLNKSGGITITQRTIPATGRVSIDIDVVREIEKSHRKLVTSGSVLTAWVMFLDAEYSKSTENQKVLGITYGASSMAIFEKSVHTYTSPEQPARRLLETMIMDHEAGHILGLVNSGTPMAAPHQDTAHGSHCSNTECLMYWETESNLSLIDILDDESVPTLDAACIADLKAAGGK